MGKKDTPAVVQPESWKIEKNAGVIFVGLKIDGPVWLKRLKKKPASKQGHSKV